METLSTIATGNDYLYFGTTEGRILKLDNNTSKDESKDVPYIIRSGFQTTKFGQLQAWRFSPDITGVSGGSMVVNFYTDHNREGLQAVEFKMPLEDTATYYFDRENINFNFRNVLIEVRDAVVKDNKPLRIGQIDVICKQIGGY